MALDSDSRAAAAIASLSRQDPALEIVVVNTGRGSLKPLLGDVMDHLVLVETSAARLPGGTRNLGIAHSTGDVIAFLAADCLATPGWAERRCAAHAQGAFAVASALRPAPNAAGHVPVAGWATYALLHSRRAPETPAADAALYGASYLRSLFDRHGLFRDDLRVGEDTEFNARVSLETPLNWAPDVVTLHRYPDTLLRASSDAFKRGQHLYAWAVDHRSLPLRASLLRVAGSWRCTLRFIQRANGSLRRTLARSAPAAAVLTMSYGIGVLTASLERRLRRPKGEGMAGGRE